MIRQPLLLTLSALGLLPLLALFITLTVRPGARADHSDSTIDLVAIDAVPEGNTATSLGEIDPCARTELGSDVDVDLVVDSIPQDKPMIAFEMRIFYDPQIVEVVAVDNDQLLGANGSFQPLEPAPSLSDLLPDSDGELRITVIDLASNVDTNSNMESGPGVLSRITLRPKANGVADLTIGADPPNFYPAILDDQNEVIIVNDIGPAAIAVGQDCPSTPAQPPVTAVATPPPAEETPTMTQGAPSRPDLSPIPPSAGPGTPDLRTPFVQATATARAALAAADAEQSGGSNGVPTALIVVLAVLGLTAAAGGGWVLYHRRQGRA